MSYYFGTRFPGSVTSITRQNKNCDSGPTTSTYAVPHFAGRVRTMFSGSENTLGTKWPQEPPQGLNHPETSIFFNSVWCSDVICHIILARDSLAAFQASQDKTKNAIVAPSFHSIRLHISQGEYPNPPSTCERKRNSASYVQARWRGWPAGQLDIYIYCFLY